MPQQASSTVAPRPTPLSRAASARQRRSSPAVMTRFMRSYGPAMRSNMRSTSAGWQRAVAAALTRAAPQRRSRSCSTPSEVEHLAGDEVDDVVERVRLGVERGHCRQYQRTGLAQLQQRLEVDDRERRLARHEHEPAVLLERHAGGAVDQVRRPRGGDRARRGHRARADHVGVHPAPSRRRRARTSRARRTGSCARRRARPPAARPPRPGRASGRGRPRRRSPRPRRRRAHADLGPGRAQAVEDAGGVGRTRGARDAEEDAHASKAIDLGGAGRGARAAG